MFTRPAELSDQDVLDTLTIGWELSVDEASYVAVGFGSHHWLTSSEGRKWFVTVDDLDARLLTSHDTRARAADSLTAALTTARNLRDAGLEFVVAPERTATGGILHRLDKGAGRFAAALYPFVDGVTYEWGAFENEEERHSVLERLIDLHRIDVAVVGACAVDDFAIPRRRELERSLSATNQAPATGPFTERACRLLADNADCLRQLLTTYDELVLAIARRPGRFVVTHGEPHRANTIVTAAGVVLIDWDTVLIAPPERDLATAIGRDEELAAEYTARTGLSLDPDAFALYRSRWTLSEIALFAYQLGQPHADTEDNRVALRELEQYLSSAAR